MHDTTWDSSQSEGPEAIPTNPGLLAKVLEASPVGITVVDAGDQTTFANRKAEEILGLAKSEITGLIYNAPEWRITTFEGGPFPDEELPFQKVRDTGKAVENVRFAIVRPDGRTVCLSINASPLTDAGGGFVGMVASLEDVTEAVETERTRTLTELKESREDWRRIFNSISDPVMILDLEQNILAANPAAEKNLELPLDRILGRKCYEAFHLIDENSEGYPFKTLIESGGAVATGEMEMEADSGTFLVAVSPIFDSEGKLSKVLHIAKDITERKQAEEALRLFRTLLDQSIDGIEVVDPETGRFLEVNERYCLTHGYSKEELLDLTIFDIDPTVDRSEYKKTLENLRRTGFMLWEGEHRRKDGTSFPVEVAIRYVKLDHDYIVTSVRDITERKRAEEAIRDGESKQRLLLQNIDEIVYMVETDEDPLKGDVTFVSGQAESITGYVPREFMEDPSTWFGNIHPDDIQAVTDSTMKLYEDKKGATRCYRLKHKVTGEYKWLEDKVVPRLDENGDVAGIFGVVRDITERKQTEDELRLLQTIIMAVSEADDLPSSIGVVLKEVCDTTGWIMGEAWMPSRDGTELECSPVWHAGIKGLDEFRQTSCRFTFPIGVGLPGRVWASKEPEWIEDVSKDEKCFRSKYAERAGIKSGVAIPVLLNDKVIAVLDFFIREPRREDRKLINMVSGVVAQLGSVLARKQAREKVKQYNMLLNAISRALVKFINDADLTAVFDDLLYRILLLTNSKFGLIGEVRNNADGQPYLCTHATTYTTGDQQAENFFKKQGPHFEFHNMDMLLGDAITKGEPVIVNDVPGGPSRGELPEGHPKITSFLGLPFKRGDRVVGLVGIANRQDSYDEEIVSYLEPLLITCTSIVEAYRNDQLRLQTEKDLVKSYKTLRNTFDGVVSALASTTESRDPYTAGHQERVSRLATAIAQELGLSKDQIKGIQMAGLLHDLGKMSVPVEILSKPGKINDHELNIIRMHTTVGNDILSSIEFPWPVARIAHQHHERMDGSGYPLGLKGDEISSEARILAVADVVEAMSSHRPYRAAKGIDAALDEIAQQSGILYDPDVADACMRLFREKGYELD